MLSRLQRAKLNDEELKTIEKLPQVLATQKKKFLIAINENDGMAGDFSKEDEQLVEDVTESLDRVSIGRLSRQWNDSKANLCVKTILEKYHLFELSQYLDCAGIVCDIFSKTGACPHDVYGSNDKMVYVLTHARQFSDPTKTIFQIEASGNRTENISVNSTLQTSQNSKFVRRANQLIEELKVEYDETKFQALNAQATSFVLLILRRVIKKHSISIYSRSYRPIMSLVIEAYMNSDDEKTKKNLRETCVKYMEWFDMQLPGLFFKVVDLYDIEAGELWDILCSVKSRQVNRSQIYLATEYYNKYQLSKANPSKSQKWFPYCRFFGNDYHKTLANNENDFICTILSNLIDRKDSLSEPAFKYTCLTMADHINKQAKPIAAELFRKISK